jgi:hypothetical protein
LDNVGGGELARASVWRVDADGGVVQAFDTGLAAGMHGVRGTARAPQLRMTRKSTGALLIGLATGIVVFAAVAQMRRRQEAQAESDVVDQQLDDSFPASDPPSWTPTRGAIAG